MCLLVMIRPRCGTLLQVALQGGAVALAVAVVACCVGSSHRGEHVSIEIVFPVDHGPSGAFSCWFFDGHGILLSQQYPPQEYDIQLPGGEAISGGERIGLIALDGDIVPAEARCLRLEGRGMRLVGEASRRGDSFRVLVEDGAAIVVPVVLASDDLSHHVELRVLSEAQPSRPYCLEYEIPEVEDGAPPEYVLSPLPPGAYAVSVRVPASPWVDIGRFQVRSGEVILADPVSPFSTWRTKLCRVHGGHVVTATVDVPRASGVVPIVYRSNDRGRIAIAVPPSCLRRVVRVCWEGEGVTEDVLFFDLPLDL